MMSRTGWREAIRMSAKRALVPKPCPLSRIARRMLVPPGRGGEGCECAVVLPIGLADGRAYHKLEDLVLVEAGLPSCGDVVVGHLVGVQRDLVDQRPNRLCSLGVVERRAPLRARRLAASLQDPRHEHLARFSDVRHWLPSSQGDLEHLNLFIPGRRLAAVRTTGRTPPSCRGTPRSEARTSPIPLRPRLAMPSRVASTALRAPRVRAPASARC